MRRPLPRGSDELVQLSESGHYFFSSNRYIFRVTKAV